MADLTTEADIIDTVLAVDLQLDPTDGDYADWLVRGEEFLQRAVDEFCNADETWGFMSGKASLTMPAAAGTTVNDGRVVLPDDIVAVGPLGRVMRAGSKYPIEYREPGVLFEMRDRMNERGGELAFYTIDNDNSGDPGKLYMYGFPFLNQANDLNLYYRLTIPLVDYDSPGSGGFDRIPKHYYRTPLLLGLREYLGRDAADARTLSDFSPAWRSALSRARVRQRGGPESLRRAGSRGAPRHGMH